MTRRIVLDLDESTTATDCGDCVYSSLHPLGGEPWCTRPEFDGELAREMRPYPPPCRGSRIIVVRRPECLAAEQRAARLVEVDPADARAILDIDNHSADAVNGANRRIVEALRAHGSKR